VGGSVLGMIPGTSASNVSAELATVAGNVAFNALQAMRDASKTGGALGSVAAKEMDLLASVEGSIRQNQSPENLKAQLGKIRESMERVKLAGQGMSTPARTGGGGGAQFQVGQEIMVQGRPMIVTGINPQTGKPRVRPK
jgi:hypothetical protein